MIFRNPTHCIKSHRIHFLKPDALVDTLIRYRGVWQFFLYREIIYPKKKYTKILMFKTKNPWKEMKSCRTGFLWLFLYFLYFLVFFLEHWSDCSTPVAFVFAIICVLVFVWMIGRLVDVCKPRRNIRFFGCNCKENNDVIAD